MCKPNNGNKTLVFFFFLLISDIPKKLITARNSTYYKEFTIVFIGVYEKMKKLSNILICIKQDVYTCLFYLLRLSWIYFSHSLRHHSLELIIRLLTLRQKIKSFLLGRCSFFRALHL